MSKELIKCLKCGKVYSEYFGAYHFNTTKCPDCETIEEKYKTLVYYRKEKDETISKYTKDN